MTTVFDGSDFDGWLHHFKIDEMKGILADVGLTSCDDLIDAYNDDDILRLIQAVTKPLSYSRFKKAPSSTSFLMGKIMPFEPPSAAESGPPVQTPAFDEEVNKWLEDNRLPTSLLDAFVDGLKTNSLNLFTLDNIRYLSTILERVRSVLKPLEFKRFLRSLGINDPANSASDATLKTIEDNVPFKTLSVDEIGLVLDMMSLEDYTVAFASNGLSGNILQHVDSNKDLEELGIKLPNLMFKTFISDLGKLKSEGVPRARLDAQKKIIELAESQRGPEYAETTSPVFDSDEESAGPVWICTYCKRENSEVTSNCSACKQAQYKESEASQETPETALDMAGTLSKELVWCCVYCKGNNAMDSLKCAKCKQDKYVDMGLIKSDGLVSTSKSTAAPAAIATPAAAAAAAAAIPVSLSTSVAPTPIATFAALVAAGVSPAPSDSIFGSLSKSQHSQLLSWLPGPLASVSLLFHSATHGKTTQEFHVKCDGQGPTLLLFRLADGSTLGAFTSIPWASTVSDTYHADASAFVFSVSPDSKRFRRIGNDDKAVCHTDPTCYGPAFGFDMYFDRRMNVEFMKNVSRCHEIPEPYYQKTMDCLALEVWKVSFSAAMVVTPTAPADTPPPAPAPSKTPIASAALAFAASASASSALATSVAPTPIAAFAALVAAGGSPAPADSIFGSLSESQHTQLLSWLPGPLASASLLFHSATHGKTSQEFHVKCDGQGPTLLLFRLTDKVTLGAFTSLSWASTAADVFVADDSAFVFCIAPETVKFRRLAYTDKAVCHTNPDNYGPAFGYDMYFGKKLDVTFQSRNCHDIPKAFRSGVCELVEVWKVALSKAPVDALPSAPVRVAATTFATPAAAAIPVSVSTSGPPTPIAAFAALLAAGGSPAPADSIFGSLSNLQHTQLLSWLPGPLVSASLLFHSVTHGKTSQEFHVKCDGQGPTLLLFRLADGSTLGAFTSVSWASKNSDTYHADGSAFVFSIFPELKKFRRIGHDDKAVCHTDPTSYGPAFGYDMYFNRSLNVKFMSQSLRCHEIPEPYFGKDMDCQTVEVWKFLIYTA